MKWYVIATAGKTADNREIKEDWLKEASEQYNPNYYGARINIDHLNQMIYREQEPCSKRYGDVLALKTKRHKNGKLQLLAQIHPTKELIELSQKRQKIYASVEIHPKFADTNKAYLTGLALTDSPASLMVEPLIFSEKESPQMTTDKQEQVFKGTITHTEPQPVEDAEEASFLHAFKEIFTKKTKESEKIKEREQALLELGEMYQSLLEGYDILKAENEAIREELSCYKEDARLAQEHAEDLEGQIFELTETLEKLRTTEVGKTPEATQVTGETEQRTTVIY